MQTDRQTEKRTGGWTDMSHFFGILRTRLINSRTCEEKAVNLLTSAVTLGDLSTGWLQHSGNCSEVLLADCSTKQNTRIAFVIRDTIGGYKVFNVP
jgi:hypothetical protein